MSSPRAGLVETTPGNQTAPVVYFRDEMVEALKLKVEMKVASHSEVYLSVFLTFFFFYQLLSTHSQLRLDRWCQGLGEPLKAHGTEDTVVLLSLCTSWCCA